MTRLDGEREARARDARAREFAHVREFVRQKGPLLLQLLGEKARDGESWREHSHGAWVRVEGDADHLFERRVVVIVCPDDGDPATFQSWATARLDRLGKYGEICNIGRMVRTLPRELAATGVFMWRVGDDPMDPKAQLPLPPQLPGFCAGFVKNVERYVALFGDEDLRYVQALRTYRVPRRGRPDERVLGLDALPTAIGGAEEPVPIAALSLVRGVLGELAEQVEDRRDELLAAGGAGPRKGWLASREGAAQLRATTDGLYEVIARVDDGRLADLAAVRQALLDVPVPLNAVRKRLLMVVGAVLLVGGVALAVAL